MKLGIIFQIKLTKNLCGPSLGFHKGESFYTGLIFLLLLSLQSYIYIFFNMVTGVFLLFYESQSSIRGNSSIGNIYTLLKASIFNSDRLEMNKFNISNFRSFTLKMKYYNEQHVYHSSWLEMLRTGESCWYFLQKLLLGRVC